jgi:hypothetical protein
VRVPARLGTARSGASGAREDPYEFRLGDEKGRTVRPGPPMVRLESEPIPPNGSGSGLERPDDPSVEARLHPSGSATHSNMRLPERRSVPYLLPLRRMDRGEWCTGSDSTRGKFRRWPVGLPPPSIGERQGPKRPIERGAGGERTECQRHRVERGDGVHDRPERFGVREGSSAHPSILSRRSREGPGGPSPLMTVVRAAQRPSDPTRGGGVLRRQPQRSVRPRGRGEAERSPHAVARSERRRESISERIQVVATSVGRKPRLESPPPERRSAHPK